jgi:hypothetical protein
MSASHWYWTNPQTGRAERYRQLTKAGTEATRINRSKAAQDNAVESVTTVLKRMGDPGGLIGWTAGLAVDAALEAGIRAGLPIGASAAYGREPEADLVAMALLDGTLRDEAMANYKIADKRAANEGTAIHDAIERHLLTGARDENPIWREAGESARAWLVMNGITKFTCEHCAVASVEHEGKMYRYGGTIDVADRRIVGDWKSVEAKANNRGRYRRPYAKECAQLAAYKRALGPEFADAALANVYFDRATGRIVNTRFWTKAEENMGWKLFTLAYDGGVFAEAIEEGNDSKDLIRVMGGGAV